MRNRKMMFKNRLIADWRNKLEHSAVRPMYATESTHDDIHSLRVSKGRADHARSSANTRASPTMKTVAQKVSNAKSVSCTAYLPNSNDERRQRATR